MASSFTLSMMSPFKNLMEADERKSGDSSMASRKIKFFNTKTVDGKSVWKDTSVTSGALIPVTAPVEDSSKSSIVVYSNDGKVLPKEDINPEILAMLEGLRPEDFVFSQPGTPRNLSSSTAPTSNRVISSKKDYQKYNFAKKTSTCELEIDCHASHVLNTKMKRIEFGSELWDEERIRCEKKGLPSDKPPSLPSTQTVNRTQQQAEKDFYTRFERLQLKGAALRKTAKDIIIKSQKESSSSSVSSSSSSSSSAAATSSKNLLLSQYLTADDVKEQEKEMEKENQKKEKSTGVYSTLLKKQEEEKEELIEKPLSQWVSQTIDTAKAEAEEQEELFHHFCGDPDTILQEYVRSSQPSPAIMNQDKETGIGVKHLRLFLGNDKTDILPQEDDVDETQQSIDQELADIYTSTQLDTTETNNNKDQKPLKIEVGYEEKEKQQLFESPSASKPPLLPKRTLSPILPSFDSPFKMMDDFYFDKKESPRSTDALQGIAMRDINEQQQVTASDDSSMDPQQHSSSSDYDLTPFASTIGIGIVGKKRDLSGKKLTSVFKKPKLPPSSSSSNSSTSPLSFSGSVVPTPKVRPSVHWSDSFAATPSESSNLRSNQLVGILLNSAEKKESLSEQAEKKKFRKSVSFVSKAVNINIESLEEMQSSFTNPAASPDEINEMDVESSKGLPLALKMEPSTSEKDFASNVEVVPMKDSRKKEEVMSQILTQRDLSGHSSYLRLIPTFSPPSLNELRPLEEYGLTPVTNPVPRFSLKQDADEFAKTIQNQNNADYNQYMTTSHKVVYEKDIPSFSFSYKPESSLSSEKESKINKGKNSSHRVPSRSRCLIPTFSPPSPADFLPDSNDRDQYQNNNKKDSVEGPATSLTADNSTQSSDPSHLLGLGAGNDSSSSSETEKMSRIVVLSMEVHCKTRKDLLPNPRFDPIDMIVWIADDIISNAEHEELTRYAGILMVLPPPYLPTSSSSSVSAASSSSSSAASPLPYDKETLLREIKMNIHSMQTTISTEKTEINIFSTEIEMIEFFCSLTRYIIDPDFLIGYESSNNSYGYLIKRGKQLDLNILQLLSRVPEEKPSFRNELIRNEMAKEQQQQQQQAGGGSGNIPQPMEEVDQFDGDSIQADVGIFIKGRTFLNTWHLLKSELKLHNNTVQFAVQFILEKTLPFFSPAQLTKWFQQPLVRYKVISHVYLLTLANLLLVEKLDLMRKISECARLYGIDFFSVFHRGSQYRVEASIIIKAHALDFLLLSPSKQKVASQAAMEVIPLVLEPQSSFYTDPVLVLDYQSLYPSMVLAYNLCYTTVMGKLKTGTSGGSGLEKAAMITETTGRLGVINYSESMSAINSTLHVKNVYSYLYSKKKGEGIKPQINESTPYVSPNGTIFCSKSVRQGILPLMIREMLETRQMVKRAMKKHCTVGSDGRKHNKVLEKNMDARQLAIKLLANVTCKSFEVLSLFFLPSLLLFLLSFRFLDGYTGAGFSGRMPMAELADAIVQSARSLLEWTIRTINKHPKWKAEVVYGDTDSVFVHLPGRNLEQAFKIGEEIAFHMTSLTPEDVVLKFEKVYYPSFLVSKKRYVGNCYEYPPPSAEVLKKVMIDPAQLASVPPFFPLNNNSSTSSGGIGSGGGGGEREYYGKKMIFSLLHKYSYQTKLNNYLFIDAKGIEMIRSDQCLLTQKIQKDILILLFSSFGDLSLVKSYLLMKWNQIMNQNSSNNSLRINNGTKNKKKKKKKRKTSKKSDDEEIEIPEELEEISFKDFIFYKDVRFGTYSSISSQPPGAIVATKEVLNDEMAIPPYNWKVPYIVVYGLPNTPLKNLVYHPKDLLKRGNSLRINYMYYIMKCVNPSLDRLLSLSGVSVFSWFQAMTRPKLVIRHMNYDTIPKNLLPYSSSSSSSEQQQQQSSSSSVITLSNLFPQAVGGAAIGGQMQQQMSMEQFILQRNCLICEINLAKATKLICETCFKHFKPFQSKNNGGKKSGKVKSSSSSSSSVVIIDNDESIEQADISYSADDMKNYLLYRSKYKILQMKDSVYENICNNCVHDTSHHFSSSSNHGNSSQKLQLFMKNEMLGKDNCGNLSCDVFHARMKLLYDLEDFSLVNNELQF
jgi:DNA polymerase elongation subunit (family B)